VKGGAAFNGSEWETAVTGGSYTATWPDDLRSFYFDII